MAKLYLYNPIIAILLFIFVSGCEEKIDIELDKNKYARLVVEGFFTDETKAHQIILSRTADYFYEEQTPRESGAIVSITSDTERYDLTENKDYPGTYETAPNVAGTIGKTYTLNIQTKEGEIFEASSALKRVADIDSINFGYYNYYGWYEYYTVLLFAQEPKGKGDFYLFNVFRDGILDNDTLYKTKAEEDSYIDGEYLYGVEVYGLEADLIIKNLLDSRVIDSLEHYGKVNAGIIGKILPLRDSLMLQRSFNDGLLELLSESEYEDYHENILEYTNTNVPTHIKVEMYSISRELYEYNNAVLMETVYSGTLFSGPPANVTTNISNGAVGFFQCSAVVTIEADIYPFSKIRNK